MAQPSTLGNVRERRHSRLYKAYLIAKATVGKKKAKVRVWLCRLYLLLFSLSTLAAFVSVAHRQEVIAQEATANAHALRCAGWRPPLPAGYRPPAGMPPPVTAPCPPVAEALPGGAA